MPDQPEKIVLDIQEYAVLVHLILAKGPKGRVFNRSNWFTYTLFRHELCEVDGRYLRVTQKGRDMFLWYIDVECRADKMMQLIRLGVLKMGHNCKYKMNFDLIYTLWLKGKLP